MGSFLPNFLSAQFNPVKNVLQYTKTLYHSGPILWRRGLGAINFFFLNQLAIHPMPGELLKNISDSG